jgi:hypothetical protein
MSTDEAKAAPANAPTIVALKVTGTRITVNPSVRTIETTRVANTIEAVGGVAMIPPRLLVVCDPSSATPKSIPMEHRIVDSNPDSVPEPLSLPIRIALLFQPNTKVRIPARTSGIYSSIALRD